MKVKKYGGKVFGAELTAAEKKAMNLEIQRQLAEYDEKHRLEIDAMALWILHTEFGFGPTRLKRFHRGFGKAYNDLIAGYGTDDPDAIWKYDKKLAEYGVNLKEWEEDV